MNLGIDPCLSNPCLNRGECIQLRYGRYKCECAGKFFWTEIDVYIIYIHIFNIYIRFHLYFFFYAGTNFYGDKCQKGEFFFPRENILYKSSTNK